MGESDEVVIPSGQEFEIPGVRKVFECLFPRCNYEELPAVSSSSARLLVDL